MSAPISDPQHFDAVVVGAGFGGLGAGLTLAERGARVLVCETLSYPGGCASTFERSGYSFESGATLFSGFGEGELFRGWIDRFGMDAVEIDWIDPVVEFRTPDWRLGVRREQAALVEHLCSLPAAPAAGIRRFFAHQRRVADVLWATFDDPGLLDPWRLGALVGHARRLPRYGVLARDVGRPLLRTLERYGVAGFEPLRTYLEGTCQITVQCGVAEAEAPMALAAIDYYHRGTGHVRGGIGVFARACTDAIERLGGTVQFANRVRSARRTPGSRRAGRWSLATRRGEVSCDALVLNLLPAAAAKLLGEEGATRPIRRLQADVVGGWGACMLYRVVQDDAGPAARHLELVQDVQAPFIEGNHLFVSLGEKGTGGCAPTERALTVSTHVRMQHLLSLSDAERGRFVGAIQERMRAGLADLAPEFEDVRLDMPGSPRTFERFTGRPDGFVGGIPRRAGFANYRGFLARRLAPGLHLVGDSVFPGQSALATALGGVRTAERVGREVAPA